MNILETYVTPNKAARKRLLATCGLTEKKEINKLHQVLLPAGDQEEEGEDDEEREAAHRRRDDDQHLPLVGRQVWRCRRGRVESVEDSRQGDDGREERVKQKEGKWNVKSRRAWLKQSG